MAQTLSNVPFWDTSEVGYTQLGDVSIWQQCAIGAIILPGLVDVVVPGREKKLDVKDAPDKGGATITPKGWSPSPVTITVTMWTPAHLAAWIDVHDELRSMEKNGDVPQPITSIVTDEVGITDIYVKRITGFEQGNKPGTKVIKIEALDAIKKPQTVGVGSGAGASGGTDQSAVWAQYKAYIAKGDAYKTTSWGDFAQAHGLNSKGAEPPVRGKPIRKAE